MVVELIQRAVISGGSASASRPFPPGAEDRTEA